MLPQYYSIKYKILLAAILPFILTLLIALPIFGIHVIDHLNNETKKYVEEMGHRFSNNVELQVNKYLTQANTLGDAITAVFKATPETSCFCATIQYMLESFLKHTACITSVWLINEAEVKDGIVYTSDYYDSSINAHAQYWKYGPDENIVKTKLDIKTYNIDSQVLEFVSQNKEGTLFPNFNLKILTIIVPIFGEDMQLKGFIGIDVNLKRIIELVKNIVNYGAVFTQIIAHNGNTIKSNEKVNIDSEKILKVSTALQTKNSYKEQYFNTELNKEVYDVYTPTFVGSNLWLARVVYPMGQAKKYVWFSMAITILVVLVFMILALIINFIIARRIATPITQISNALESIAFGQHEVEIPDIKCKDEIGKITQAARVFKSYANQLIIAKQAAESANKIKSDFLANMSHELRTPMHAILAYTKLAIDLTTEAKLIKYLTNINRSAERLLNLLNNLLDLSKLEAGKMEFNFKEQNIAECIANAIQELDSLVKAKELSLNTNIFKLNLIFDYEKLFQVIINLLSNAIKFSPNKGVIEVKLKQQDSNVLISITNEGPHIPEYELVHIFKKYVSSAKTKKEGTGLGLAIAFNIIKKHSGKIWCENTQNGVCFNIELPTLES